MQKSNILHWQMFFHGISWINETVALAEFISSRGQSFASTDFYSRPAQISEVIYLHLFTSLVPVQRRTEVPRTPSSTRPGSKLWPPDYDRCLLLVCLELLVFHIRITKTEFYATSSSDGRVFRAGISVTWKALSWFGGQEFETWSCWTWVA